MTRRGGDGSTPFSRAVATTATTSRGLCKRFSLRQAPTADSRTSAAYILLYACRRDPRPIPGLLRPKFPRRPAELITRPGRRSDAVVHERGHGAVQEGVP